MKRYRLRQNIGTVSAEIAVSHTVKMGLGISRLIFTITGLVSYDLLPQRKWKRHSKSISKTKNGITANGYTVI